MIFKSQLQSIVKAGPSSEKKRNSISFQCSIDHICKDDSLMNTIDEESCDDFEMTVFRRLSKARLSTISTLSEFSGLDSFDQSKCIILFVFVLLVFFLGMIFGAIVVHFIF